MGIIAAIFALVALLWGALLVCIRPRIPVATPAWLGIASFFTSIVAGYFLWHRDFGPLPLTIDRAILGLAWLVWLYGWAIGQYRLPRFEAIDWLVLAWLAVAVLSVICTDYGFRESLPLKRLLFFYLLPGATYFLLRFSPMSRAHHRALLWLLVLLGVYLGATGLAEWRRWNGLIFPSYLASPTFPEFYGRGRGPLLNPVINGMLLSLAGAACLLLLPLTQRRYWPVLLLALGISAVGALSTLTRSCWIGFGLSVFLICLAPLNWRQRTAVTLLAGMLGVVGIGALSSQLNRFKRDEFVSAEEMAQSAGLRPVLAVVAWEMFKDYPLTGVGLGQYSKYKKPYHQLDDYDLPLQSALPYMQHNVVLSWATEMGLAGLLVAGMVWLVMGRQAIHSWSARDTSLLQRCFGLWLLVALLNYLVNGMFHDVSIITDANLSLLLATAMAVSSAPQPVVSPDHSLRLPLANEARLSTEY